MEVKIIKGSVVYAKVDVIVNAANSQLQAGGGVCGAIFSKCNNPQKLQEECNSKAPCMAGNAVITKSYGLNAQYIIHAVGPIYHNDKDSEKLASAYRCSLQLVDDKGLTSIAFCSISTGIFGYPLKKATVIALDTIKEFKAKSLKECYVYCFGDEEYQIFIDANN